MEEKKSIIKIGFWEILFFIFLVLKLTKVITFSWWIVCAPLLVPYSVIFIIGTTLAVLGIIAEKTN